MITESLNLGEEVYLSNSISLLLYFEPSKGQYTSNLILLMASAKNVIYQHFNQ